MTIVTRTLDSQSPIVLERAEVRSWKAPIALAVFVVIGAAVFIGFGRDGASTFVLSRRGDAIQIPGIVAPTLATCIAIVLLLAAITAWSAYRAYRARKTPVWALGLFGFLFVVGFLTWAAAGASLPVSGLLIGTLGISVPLIFGALGGVISERAGVVNVAIEGQLLAGAFVAAVVASVTRQPLLGLAAAMIAGVLVSFVLAAFAIKYLVDQVIVGVVLNVLVAGLTSFLFSQVLSEDTALLNSPPGFDPINIPILSEIPILGPVLFRQTIIVYVMYVAIAAVWFALYRTRWGLRVRSVGEHPHAADSVGINVASTRFWSVSLAGAIAGFGGAYLTLDAVGSFNKEMTAGAGFIALAAVIFGRWDPIKATLAALLFGFATNLQNVLSIIGSPVPSEFMLMLPYIVTIFAVAGLVGKSRPPAADGKPFIKS